MATRFAERPEVEPGDPPVAKNLRRRRLTIGRFMTELAIITVGVGIGLNWLAPVDVRYPAVRSGEALLGSLLLSLAARMTWILLKKLNDACERACDVYWPMTSRTAQKPKPPDDL